MSSEQEIKKYQRQLDNDMESKNMFVNNSSNDSDDTENESDSDDKAIGIIPLPKKHKSSRLDNMLMEQLIKQQKAYLNAQKTIYKLKNEIETEEIKMRYLKLDLNNSQVKTEETIEDNKKLKQDIFICKSENFMHRGLIILYIIYIFFNFFIKF